MSNLSIKIEMNKGRVGVPVIKLTKISNQKKK
jgi:hypothetical protein